MKFGKKKTKRQVNSSRVELERMFRFNPLRNLSPDYLRNCHDEFSAGTLRSAARLWEEIEDTDDILKVVAAKRKKAVSRHGFEIIADDDSPEAKKHADALKFFYDQLSTTRVDDRNIRGGFPLLLRQMMDATGKKYAVHEIVWKPINGKLTAEFWFVPLWYFENRSGQLRYLPSGGARDGQELEPGEWLVTSGDGVMRAAAVAYMFKHLPLQDWLIYSENFGRPIPKGKSNGAPGSDEWEAMEAAVAALADCDGVVVSADSDIEALSLEVKGNLPHPALVERMDRALASLWRGADLSTLSQGGESSGASVQGDETDLLEDDDAENLTDILNEQVDKFVIKYMFGTAAPKAWVKVKCGVREDTEADLKIDKQLDEMGYETPLEDLQRRYGRPTLQPKGTQALANEELDETARDLASLQAAGREGMGVAVEQDVIEAYDRIAEIIDNAETYDELIEQIKAFQSSELLELTRKALVDPAAAEAAYELIGAAVLNGIAQAAEDRDQEPE